MKTGTPNRFPGRAALGLLICVALFGLMAAAPAGVAWAYDTGPALRQDFQGTKEVPPPPEQGPAYDTGPALRMDFLGKKSIPPPEPQGPAYDSAPPLRMDFQGSRRVDPDR